MATTDLNAKFDEKFVVEFNNYLPKDLKVKITPSLLSSGFYQRDRIMEFACANTSGGMYTVTSEDCRDFSDNSDMKTITLNRRKSSTTPKAIITAVKNKVGPLRVVALDPDTNEFRYYFIFDFEGVRNYDRIEFNPYGTSKYNNGECGIECSSFEELAKISEKDVKKLLTSVAA